MKITTAMLLVASLTYEAAVGDPEVVAQPAATKHVTVCQFVRPADLADGPTTWIGDCVGGHAKGAGVLRVLRQGGEPRFFFGTMAGGQPRRGVVTQDNNDDVVAWRFEGTRSIEPTDRAQTAQIYRVAGAGAAAAADRFRAQGNIASAKYYAAWSHTLATALNAIE